MFYYFNAEEKITVKTIVSVILIVALSGFNINSIEI